MPGSAKGSASSSLISLQTPVTLVPGKNKIDLLSTTVGLSVIYSSLTLEEMHQN